MRFGHFIAETGKLLTGIGLGAAGMYLLDPDSGDRRREHLKERTGQAVGTSGAAMAALWEQTRDNAASLSHRARDQFEHLRERDVVEQLRHLAHGRRRSATDHHPLAIVGAAVGALAVGAGIMFLMDPQHGSVRRSLIKNQATRAARGARGYVQSTVGRVTGGQEDQPETSADVNLADEQLAARVRSEIAIACTHPTDVYVSVRGDHVVLSGSLPAEEQELVVSRCQLIPGVSRVVNNLTETATA